MAKVRLTLEQVVAKTQQANAEINAKVDAQRKVSAPKNSGLRKSVS